MKGKGKGKGKGRRCSGVSSPYEENRSGSSMSNSDAVKRGRKPRVAVGKGKARADNTRITTRGSHKNSITGLETSHDIITVDSSSDDSPVIAQNANFVSNIGNSSGESFVAHCYIFVVTYTQ